MTDTPDSDDAPAGPPAGLVPCIEVLEGRKRGRVYPLDRVRAYVIGRLPGAEIHIDDPGVSRRHVRIIRRPDDAIEVADMRSTNGLVVNGERVERATLAEGDLLSLGPDAVLRLGYRPPDQLDAPIVRADDGFAEGEASEASDPRERVEATLSGEDSTAIVIHRPKLDELPLSARQLEVSRLVATGLTNAAIAESLGISPRTVTSHLDHIYGRLGIGSRAALTRWIVERGLLEPDSRADPKLR